MLKEKYPIIFPRHPSNAAYCTLKDAVFVRRIGDEVLYAFALGIVKKSASYSIDEIVSPKRHGVSAGTGVFRVSGDLIVPQNSYIASQALGLNVGELYDLHLLYRNGEVLSFPGRLPSTYTKLPLTYFRNLKQRYPRIEDFRNDEIGVRFSIAEAGGGNNAELKLHIEGLSFETRKYKPSSETEFYQLIPKLNRGLTLKPGADLAVLGKSGTGKAPNLLAGR